MDTAYLFIYFSIVNYSLLPVSYDLFTSNMSVCLSVCLCGYLCIQAHMCVFYGCILVIFAF